MTIYDDIESAQSQTKELYGMLTEDHIELLRTNLMGTCYTDWYDWIYKNTETVHAFSLATPSERRKKWGRNTLLFSQLALASIHRMDGANALLETLERHSLGMNSPMPYRVVGAVAGKAFLELCQHRLLLWPFAQPNLFVNDFDES